MRTAILLDTALLRQAAKTPGKAFNTFAFLGNLAANRAVAIHKATFGAPVVASEAEVYEANGFVHKAAGVDITLYAADLISRKVVDFLILVTDDFDTGRILKYARDNGVYTRTFSLLDQPQFAKYAEAFTLDETLLNEGEAGQ